MITYKFPVKEFSATAGYDRIAVRENKLELENKPGQALLALIEQYGGELEATKKTKKPATKKTGGE